MGKNEVVLCDTDVIIEFYRNNAEIVTKLRAIGQQNIAISIITAGELLYGALNKKELTQIKKDLDNLTLLPIDHQICKTFTDIMGTYVLSHKLALPDGFIAATAMVHDVELFTLNFRDYRFIDGLRLFKK